MIGPRTRIYNTDTFFEMDLLAENVNANPPRQFSPGDWTSNVVIYERAQIARRWELEGRDAVNASRECLSRAERRILAAHILSEDCVAGTSGADTGLGLREMALALRKR